MLRSSRLAVRSPVYLVATVAYGVGLSLKTLRKQAPTIYRLERDI